MTISAVNGPYTKSTSPRRALAQPLIAQKLACLIALPVSVACLVLSVPMLFAGVASEHAELALRYWQRSEAPPSESYWNMSLQRAASAVEQTPITNAEYLDRLGRVLLWGPLVAPEGSGSEGQKQSAIQAFRESVEARPAWPWSWLRLAYAKQGLHQLDDEFDLAMRRTNELGAGRPELDGDLAALGFSAWSELTPSQRIITLEAANRSAASSKKEALQMYNLARASGLATPLCWSLGSAVKAEQQICKEEGSQ
ncbi:hypothetical protein [Pseudomonas profundi]|uniref:hypothetical protein n=1 Tax=Pseudomonas profundi TaxID=1981513 RepID=UPI0012389A45|nr:hypothetical protein [Pseudomonas profundi]